MLTRLTNFKGESTLKRAGLDMLVGMISQDEISDLKAQFIAMDRGGDGTIDVTELGPILKKAGLKMKEEQLKKIISEMDYKSDGKINYTEFISATLDV